MALFFTYALPLVLPTAIYMLWRLITVRYAAGHGANRADRASIGSGTAVASEDDPWRDAPWLWLALAGAVLLAVVLFLGIFVHESPPPGEYVPPHLEDGHIMPGALRENRSGSPSGTQ